MEILDRFALNGQVAIVTGGATGLGLSITKCLAEAGSQVIVLGRSKYEDIKKDLEILGDKVKYISFDITDTEKIPNLVESIIKQYGKISVLVNNAGNHCKKPIEEMSVEDFQNVLNVHLTGAFALTKAIVPHMKENKDGSIIFQASMTSYIGQPNVTGYSTAKAGILGLVHTLAAECGSYNVRVNAIAPGWIDTPMFKKATENDPTRLNKILGRIPMNNTGEPDDIGMATLFLASSASKYINGICLPVDGGALIGF